MPAASSQRPLYLHKTLDYMMDTRCFLAQLVAVFGERAHFIYDLAQLELKRECAEVPAEVPVAAPDLQRPTFASLLAKDWEKNYPYSFRPPDQLIKNIYEPWRRAWRDCNFNTSGDEGSPARSPAPVPTTPHRIAILQYPLMLVIDAINNHRVYIMQASFRDLLQDAADIFIEKRLAGKFGQSLIKSIREVGGEKRRVSELVTLFNSCMIHALSIAPDPHDRASASDSTARADRSVAEVAKEVHSLLADANRSVFFGDNLPSVRKRTWLKEQVGASIPDTPTINDHLLRLRCEEAVMPAGRGSVCLLKRVCIPYYLAQRPGSQGCHRRDWYTVRRTGGAGASSS